MTLSERLASGGSVVGTMLRLRDPAAVPLAKEAGLDFVMLDMEHGPYSFETLADFATAGRLAGLPALVRVPELARGTVSRALDCGAGGVMVPMLETAEQARQFVQWAKYPPLGGRGFSGQGPHTAYRRLENPADGMARINREILAIAQIETAAAVAAADAIAAVPGIDVLLIGPNDLSVSLGHPGQTDAPDELDAIGRVGEACARHGKVFGMHAPAAALAPWAAKGMRFLMNGVDVSLLQKGFAQVVTETRRSLP